MKLYEFQGKRLFKEYGIPIQQGNLINPGDNLLNLSPPLVLKSQVLTGGRGKAGGIQIWDGQQDINKMVEKLFELEINNERVKTILALNSVDIQREVYLSITFNRSKSTPVLIAGAAGGIDIEKAAHEKKNQVFFIEFNSLLGILDYQIRIAAKYLEIENVAYLRKIILSMYRIFKDYDATLVEINPLAVTPDGLIAIDSKIELDGQAAFRQQNLYTQLKEEIQQIAGDELQLKSEDDTITYVPLLGNIGVVTDGAGTGILTLDLLAKYGGNAASFCDLGGITSPEVVQRALQMVHEDPKVKSILVVLIGGFNRMDEMAEGIVRFFKETTTEIPISIRMCGTKEEEGKRMMQDAQIHIYSDLHDAVKNAIKKAVEK